MYHILENLTRLIAPVLSFTADEIWQHLPGEREQSVHLASFPKLHPDWRSEELEERYQKLLAIRSDVSKALELARGEKTIGHSLDARVTLAASDEVSKKLLTDYRDELATLFIVSQVELVDSLETGVDGEEVKGLKVAVAKANGEKCERCWNYAESVGQSSDHPSICDRCETALGA
jgi:isoleucyl-tRNA synthetase